MLSRQQRYPLRQDKTFFQSAQKLFSPSFTLFLKKDEALKTSQGAIIIPLHTVYAIVERNKRKRKISALLSPFLKTNPGIVVVILGKKNFPANYEEELQKLFQRIEKNKV